MFGGSNNVTRVYSPITMNQDWPILGRLIFMTVSCCIGSIANGFFIASFIIEHTLRKVGNVYLACIGVTDMLITSFIMLTVAVILLSGQWDILPVCYCLQFLVQASTYCYSMFFVLIAAESYCRVCRTSTEYQMFISMPIGIISFMVFVIGFSLAGVGIVYGLDYDYCLRNNHGNINFRIATTVIFHGIPFILIITGLFSAFINVHRRAEQQSYYKRSQQFERDFSITCLNITVYLIYVLIWIPYLVVVYVYPDTSDQRYYHCAWIGVYRCVFPSFLYYGLNKNFRHAFVHLFYYCFCKSTLTGSVNGRHRRSVEYKAAAFEIRVHILHKVTNSFTAQRGAGTSRETQDL